MEKKFAAVIVAAGSSSRMGTGRAKVLEDLGGHPVLWHSVRAFARLPEISEIVAVCREQEREAIAEILSEFSLPTSVVPGGDTRQDSVKAGIQGLTAGPKYVLVHDGARPLVTGEVIRRVCADAEEYGAATAAVQVKDTVKLGDGFVEETPPREKLFAVQTPQGFELALYHSALKQAEEKGRSYTDDCQLIEAFGGRVKLTQGDYRNIKITTPEDLITARGFIGEAERSEQTMRIGQGYDVHRLVPGRKLILGGVEIPYEKGLLGHSDADVLAHAISDALLGAAALGDIGHLFPDNDPRYEGADSLKLLAQVVQVVGEAGYGIENIDATVIAQRPKLAPYIVQMREKLAAACSCRVEQISVKATTEEGLGFTGTGEGISASAVCLLKSR